MKTALVLSAGGMFGAYQAGAWKALAGVLQPDLVVGTSAGSLNGWAIAGGCSPEELAEIWLDPAMERMMRVRWRRSCWKGLWDPAPLEESVERLFAHYQPRVPYALTLTEVPRMRPRLVRGEEVTWRHLVASCAVPCGFPPVRIEGRLYVDGGLLGVLPVWAAVECGATRVIAVNAMPFMPSWVARTAAGMAYRLGPGLPASGSVEVLTISRPKPLGTLAAAIHWKRENALRWMELGEEDAAPIVRTLAGERALPLK
jgi:NTE family protein